MRGTVPEGERHDPATLPVIPEITAITMAELHQDIAMAKSAATRAARAEKLGPPCSNADDFAGLRDVVDVVAL